MKRLKLERLVTAWSGASESLKWMTDFSESCVIYTTIYLKGEGRYTVLGGSLHAVAMQ